MKARLVGRPRDLTLPVVLVDGSAAYRGDLARLLRQAAAGLTLAAYYPDLTAYLASPPAAAAALLLSDDLAGLQPELVAVGFARGAQRVVVLVTDPAAARLAALRQAGAALVFKYSPAPVLLEAVTAVPPRVAGRLQSVPGPSAPPVPLPAGPRVITVYSPAGGSGKTLLATHLAAGLARQGRRTVLADLAQFGAVAPAFRQGGQGKGLSNLASILDQDPRLAQSPRFGEYVRQAVLTVRTGGAALDLLPAPHPARADQIRAEQIEAVLRNLQALHYERIVVDTGSDLSPRTAAALTASTLVLAPVPPDFTAAFHCLQLREMLQALAVPRHRVAVVVNRWRTDVAFSLDEFRELVRLPILAVLPDAPRLAQRLGNQGRLVSGRWGLGGALARLLAAVESGAAMEVP